MAIVFGWQEPKAGRFALFYLGFRPFFPLASLSGALLGLVWLLNLTGISSVPTAWPSTQLWHGHEMIFGFGMAVIVGFLLTAIRNWTGLQTLHRWPLAVLAALWLTARALNIADVPLFVPAIFDLLFGIGAALATTMPIVRARQWRQVGLVSKVWLLAATNAFSYAWAHAAGLDVMALIFGLLLIVAMLLTMIHRVLPFFIEKAAQMTMQRKIALSRFPALQKANLALFLSFTGAWLLWPEYWTTRLLAWALALLNARILVHWAHPVVFRTPLLWSLWGAYAFMIVGFALTGLSVNTSWLTIHAFGVGGMGLAAAGMMIRVTLGHTARNVFAPGKTATLVLGLMLAAALLRIAGPAMAPQAYSLWLGLSLLGWIAACALLFIRFLPMWIRPRIDGHYG